MQFVVSLQLEEDRERLVNEDHIVKKSVSWWDFGLSVAHS